MSILDWMADRVLTGMMAEEQCWRVHADFDLDEYVATDLSRYTGRVSTLLDIDLDQVSTYRVNDKGARGYELVKFHVRLQIAKAGLMFLLQFWRREP